MSLDVYLENVQVSRVFSANITHNLNRMAEAAGIYKHLWRPDELGLTKAWELIVPLREGLKQLRDDPDKFKALNPENGWGSYEGLMNFVYVYLDACEENHGATLRISR